MDSGVPAMKNGGWRWNDCVLITLPINKTAYQSLFWNTGVDMRVENLEFLLFAERKHTAIPQSTIEGIGSVQHRGTA